MADRYDNKPESESDEDGQSVFDLFEPPPPTDPNSFGKIPVIKDDEIDLTDGASDVERKAAADVEAAGLQHWTAPPTGQVPAVLSEKESKSGLWGDVAGPSWHGDDPTWSGPDLADVFADADAIRLDDYADDEDDEEEDDEFRRPPPVQQAPPRPIDRVPPPSVEPPLAAAPERREPPVRSWPTNGEHDGAADPNGVGGDPGRPAARPVPRPRLDPAPAPEPHPGANADRATWPTSPDPRPRRELETTGLERPAADPPSHPRPDPRPERVQPERPQPERPQGGPVPKRGLLSSQDITAPGLPTHAPNQAAGPPPERPSLFDDERSVPSIDDIEFADDQAAAGQRFEARLPTGRLGRGAPEEQVPAGAFADDGHYEDEYEHYEDEYEDYDGIEDEPRRSKAGRNLPMAIAVGAGLIAVLAGALWLGPEMTLLLVVVLALVGVVELYNAMRLAGLRPANLLGIVGTAAAPAAAFYRGDAGMPLIVGLTVVFGALWYLVGADSERPVLNLSLTMMGIFWVGGLASFAGLMLREDGGLDLLLAAIIITVVSDTMAYVGGRAYGRRPFHPASPNKTWEGTITGFLGALFAGFAIGAIGLGELWDGNFFAAIALGAVVGVLAPIGDLTESVVKRDLGIKDMGQLLPGHGGVLDRVDALLFALPGAYYLALVAGLI